LPLSHQGKSREWSWIEAKTASSPIPCKHYIILHKVQ
jgi:hypothetical protein